MNSLGVAVLIGAVATCGSTDSCFGTDRPVKVTMKDGGYVNTCAYRLETSTETISPGCVSLSANREPKSQYYCDVDRVEFLMALPAEVKP